MTQQANQPGPEMTPGTPEYIQRMVDLADGRSQQPDNNQQSFQNQQMPQRPEWVPEKFWDAKTGQVNMEAMAKSYVELEKRGAQQPSQQQNQQTPQPEAAAADAVKAAGLDWDALTNKIGEKGELDLSDYAALSAIGVPKEVVDNYIEGIKYMADARVERTAEYVASQTGTDGHEMLENMLVWAKDSLPQTTVNYLNTLLASENDWKAGLDQLGEAYMKAHPMMSEGKAIVGGGSGGGGGAFESQAEMSRAINDPRYKESPSYREQVRQRILLSNV